MLYAIDAKSGQQKWPSNPARTTSSQPGRFQGSPAVVDGRCTSVPRRPRLRDRRGDGTKKWDYPTASLVIATPAVRDGVVYAGTSDSSRFMAIDAKTGAS